MVARSEEHVAGEHARFREALERSTGCNDSEEKREQQSCECTNSCGAFHWFCSLVQAARHLQNRTLVENMSGSRLDPAGCGRDMPLLLWSLLCIDVSSRSRRKPARANAMIRRDTTSLGASSKVRYDSVDTCHQPLKVCWLTPVGRKFRCLHGQHRATMARPNSECRAVPSREQSSRCTFHSGQEKPDRNNGHMTNETPCNCPYTVGGGSDGTCFKG